jgi:hypothetical protein
MRRNMSDTEHVGVFSVTESGEFHSRLAAKDMASGQSHAAGCYGAVLRPSSVIASDITRVH